METPVSPAFDSSMPPAPKKSNTGLIIGIIAAVLLCCCCLIVAGGAFFYISNSVSNTYSSINEQLLTPVVVPDFPAPSDPSNPSTEPSVPTMPDEYVPQGGLGDDLLRANTWAYVLIAAAATDCVSPQPQDTVIKVTQEQDSAGVWEERWTLTCSDGKEQAFDITFTPDPNGGTNINVKSVP